MRGGITARPNCAPLRLGADADPAGTPLTAPEPPQTAEAPSPRGDDHPRPETALWDALVDAGPEGVSVAELEAACGMGRRWVYYRLQAHATAGRAVQVRRGYWRAARPSDGPAGDGRPPPAPHRADSRAGRAGTPRPVTVSNRIAFVHGPRAYTCRAHTRRGRGRGRSRTVAGHARTEGR